MLKKIQTFQPCDETPHTNAYQKHTPTNFVYYIKYCNCDYKPPVEYSGMDTPKIFYKKIKEGVLYIAKKYYDKIIHMNQLTKPEKIKFRSQKTCHICGRPFNALPPMLEKKILITKNAIHYYKSLNDEQSVDKYSRKLEKIENDIKINTKSVVDHDHLTDQFR
jgi:hypothetical protein